MTPPALRTPRAPRRLRLVVPVVALAVGAAAPARAQESERGSRFMESGHWAYEYIARLRTTAGARLSALAPWLELAADYQQVSSFAYRAYGPGDRYDYLGRGLGESFADHERLSIAADIFPPIPGLTLTPAFVALRQGEGDFRVAMPSDSIFRLSPNLILGVAERTYRFGLRGRYQPTRHLWLTWDAGQNLLRDADHVAGRSRSEFVGLGEVGLRFDFGTRPR